MIKFVKIDSKYILRLSSNQHKVSQFARAQKRQTTAKDAID